MNITKTMNKIRIDYESRAGFEGADDDPNRDGTIMF